jgi:predicted RNA binding protein YcfA (HicA-like mRNA interferase family)
MDVRKIRKAVIAAGLSWEVAKGQHVIIKTSTGRQVAVMSGSPSEPRAMLNFIANLRQAGVRIPRKGEKW